MNGNKPGDSSRRWVIIHGHFYQPPRENPWLNVIESQEGASPYHDWNERIYAECYRPNGYSRMLDPNGMIKGIHNNYASMSFNFGPTLMEWLEKYHPVTTARIIEGDRISATMFGGHGNAIAQVYNHIIMPLASRRDQLTQIRWGKASYKRCFGRLPEGIWLAETAVNMETVRCLIEEKIAFIILSPRQAESFRRIDSTSPWIPAAEQALDTRRPYRLYARNSSGKKEGGYLDVFFFDEQLSKEVSFGTLLHDAYTFGRRIESCFTAENQNDEVVVIATDGETFGHHKPFGDMCLAYFFTNVAPELGIRPVNFGYYLSLHQPQYEVTLKNEFGEGTAWSCSHGTGRWKRDCGCRTGGEEGWNQKWRTPMRRAIDNLQDTIDETFAKTCKEYGIDPWEARDLYGKGFGVGKRNHNIILPRKWKKLLTKEDIRRLHRQLEAQKYMLFAYTSCGWFFADISGIEAMQNLAYACRALQLGIEQQRRQEVMKAFMSELANAKSNVNDDTGASLFERNILPFFFHEHMISLTAAIEYVLGLARKNELRLYGYDCVVRPLKRQVEQAALQDDDTKTELRGFCVAISNESTAEQSRWLVITELADLKEPGGWVLPWKDEFDEETLYLSKIRKNPQGRHYSLSEVFLSLKQDLSEIYLKKINRRSQKTLARWMQANESDLALLRTFHPSMPDHFRAPLAFILQSRWDAVFVKLNKPGEEKACISELIAIMEKINYFKVSIDKATAASVCEKLLVDELDKLTQNLNTDSCKRIRYLLEIVDRFSLPVSKHRFEDIFYPVIEGRLKPLYQEVVTIEGENMRTVEGKKKELLLELLSFARRMNFNTDDFPMP